MNDKQQKEQNFKFGKKIIKNGKEYESFSYVGWNGKNQPIISIIDCETGKQYTRVIHKKSLCNDKQSNFRFWKLNTNFCTIMEEEG